MKGTFEKKSDVNQLDVGLGKGLFGANQQHTSQRATESQSAMAKYAHVPARIRSIRRSDDNLMKKTKKFEKQYSEAMALQ